MQFNLQSPFKPTGDQPQAIAKLTNSLHANNKHQVLLGVTGSGKTFTLANVIQNVQKPTLVISHNKTLAAQLYQEFRDFFPDNTVSYFVSYYDYYQPEAYVPQTDTYIEKEAEINDDIERLRLQATANLLTRKDVIVVASVSCIYNLGSPLEWGNRSLTISLDKSIDRRQLLAGLTDLQYDRSDYELTRGTFRVKGDTLELWPAYEQHALKLRFLEDKIEKISSFDPVSGSTIYDLRSEISLVIYPAKHYLTDRSVMDSAFTAIRLELNNRLRQLKQAGRELEAHRLHQKVTYDLEMIQEMGYVNGIENYSRHFDSRKEGDPPYTLMDYFAHNTKDYLVIIDESHMTIPQINGMYRGDQARKQTLIDFGFRLPSAIDNRPLKFDEFLRRLPQAIYTSATPGPWELSMSKNIVEQLIRPTGLVDPPIEIRPTEGQIPNLIKEIEKRVAKSQRVLVTTLTKRMAEALSEHLKEKGIKVNYLHSDIATLDRSDILDSLRGGDYDVIVGINLLREGLDLPEVSLVAILDADKEGFLRSTTSLIQTMGRAARHVDGQVIMYADTVTKSMQKAIDEVTRRRQIQLAYNQTHRITPKSIQKPIREKLLIREPKVETSVTIPDLDSLTPEDKKRLAKDLKKQMLQAAKNLNFELAASLRDTIESLKSS